ncbi:MAG TPA: hypothetical protein EYO73_08855 [Sulfurimonas sp.]|nr:hypothetical protein [Sulfurimonas sp.]
MFLRYICLCFLSLGLYAQDPPNKKNLGDLESKLYAYILKTQIKEHDISQFIGTWPSNAKYLGARKTIPDSNSFMTFQTLILLHDVNQVFELPHINKVYSLSNTQMQNYVQDARKNHEPKGTLSFWPLLQIDKETYIHSFDTQWYNTSLRILDIANDFDTSSQAFVWFYFQNIQPQFLKDFTFSLALYTDTNRSLEHPLNKQWKDKSTGAFMTWAEDEAPHKNPNRIMDLVNDVDCVVNLNILTSLSLYENTINSLPPLTQIAKEKSCKLIHKVIINKQENKCGTWYTRPSHFYLSFSKAYKADTYCIQDHAQTIIQRSKKRAKYLLQHPNMHAYTEVAEYLIILKTLKKEKKRSFLYLKLLKDLQKYLKEGLSIRGDYAYLPSKQSLFGGQAFGLFHFDWYGRSNATALTLRALSMP